MKRFAALFVLLTLVACSRRQPTPTVPPSPTASASPTALPSFTPTPDSSPVPRITIVPSATRIQPTEQVVTGDVAISPTIPVELLPTPVPSVTLTPRVLDASATATPPGSLAPTPTSMDSPLAPPTATAPVVPLAPVTPSATLAPLEPTQPSAPTIEATPSATPGSIATPGSTAVPTPQSEAWRFENMFTFYDDAFQEFYILGQVVNSSGSDQRIKALMPVVYDDNGDPVTDEESVDVPPDYEQMREAISLAPEQSFSFGFLVYLPRGFAFNNKYEILIESEPAEPARDDLEITKDDFDMTDWPSVFYVEGAYDNPGPDLDKHIAVVVTVYDDEMRVIGLDWFFGTDAGSLKSGEHGFEVEVDLWEIIGDLELEVHSYKVQVFGN